MKKAIAMMAVLLTVCLGAAAKPKLNPVWNADFNYVFDNREFDAGGNHFTGSMTIHAVNFQPTVGIRLKRGRYQHTVNVGMDLYRDMGCRFMDNEYCLLWYSFLDKSRGKPVFSATFGAFPRHLLEGDYGRAFISDSVKVYDRTIEGALLRWKTGKLMAELGCDWSGRQAVGVRERFEVFTYGQYRLGERLSAGWTMRLDHFANPAEAALGVVDNILAEPFVAYDLTPAATGWEKVRLRLSWLESVQRSRAEQDGFMFNGGAELRAEAVFRGFGVESDNYVGGNLMPLYSKCDAAGVKYGGILYHGDPFYQAVGTEGGVGAYSRNALFWHKDFTRTISMRLSWIFHFSDYGKGFLYQGSQQMFTAVVRL